MAGFMRTCIDLRNMYFLSQALTISIEYGFIEFMSVKGITATQKRGKIKSDKEREREREFVLDKNEDFNGIESADSKD